MEDYQEVFGSVSLAELVVCVGFFLVYLVEELAHIALFRKNDKILCKNKTNKVITDNSRMRMKTSKKTLLRRRTRRRVRSLRSAAIRKSVQSKAPRGIM